LPTDTGTVSVYFGPADTIAAHGEGAVCGLNTATKQPGLLKEIKGPKAADGSQVTIKYVYDNWGRMVGTKRTGDAAWSCVSTDARGRVTKTETPTSAALPQREVTTTYDFTDTPRVFRVQSTEKVFSTSPVEVTTYALTDLLGRTVASTDYWQT